MSLKQNIEMVRAELNSEEKFFEKAVLTERFVKKYKKVLITSFAVVIVAVAANIIYEINDSSKVVTANNALIALKSDATNEELKKQLEQNGKNLYQLWSFSQAIANKDSKALEVLYSSKAPLIGDLSKYENAKTIKELDEYAKNKDAIYKDLALVQSAILLMNEEQIDKAHQKLRLIGLDSPMAEISSALLHYGVK